MIYFVIETGYIWADNVTEWGYLIKFTSWVYFSCRYSTYIEKHKQYTILCIKWSAEWL